MEKLKKFGSRAFAITKKFLFIFIAFIIGFVVAPSETTRTEYIDREIEVERVIEIQGDTIEVEKIVEVERIEEIESTEKLQQLADYDERVIMRAVDGLITCRSWGSAIASNDTANIARLGRECNEAWNRSNGQDLIDRGRFLRELGL